MKSQICNVCLNSDILCKACRKNLENGSISEHGISILKMINDAAKRFKPLEGIEIKKVVDSGRVTVVICRRGDGARLVGREGAMVKKLSKIAGKEIRVVEESGDLKEFIQNLINPVPLIGLNVVYTPGEEVLKVLIPYRRRVPIEENSLSDIVRQVFGKDVMVESE